jgi:hypothetical protein
VNQARVDLAARFGDGGRRGGVDHERGVGIGFSLVDRGVSGGIDHDVWL